MAERHIDDLREELIRENPVYRELARTHARYETRLRELQSLAYPTDGEQLEERQLKKLKLAAKDEMYTIMMQHAQAMSAGA